MSTATDAAQPKAPRSLAVAAIPDPKVRDFVMMVGVLAAEIGSALASPWHGDHEIDIAAGVLIGGWGKTKISPSVAGYLEHFWDYVAGVANALIFLLVGLTVKNRLWWPNRGPSTTRS